MGGGCGFGHFPGGSLVLHWSHVAFPLPSLSLSLCTLRSARKQIFCLFTLIVLPLKPFRHLPSIFNFQVHSVCSSAVFHISSPIPPTSSPCISVQPLILSKLIATKAFLSASKSSHETPFSCFIGQHLIFPLDSMYPFLSFCEQKQKSVFYCTNGTIECESWLHRQMYLIEGRVAFGTFVIVEEVANPSLTSKQNHSENVGAASKETD